MNELSKIPYTGIGMGLRREITNQIIEHKDKIDVVEIISERFFSYRTTEQSRKHLQNILTIFPVIPHGVTLSIGSATEFEKGFLDELKKLNTLLGAHYYSDHFALTRNDELSEIGHLSPLWYTKEALELIIEKIDRVQQYLGIPLVLENITTDFIITEADYDEPEFISEVCNRTGCGLLLDVTNVFINSHNRKQDPLEMTKRYPMDSVVQVHLAGGIIESNGQYVDTHSEPVHEGVWPLLEYTANNADIKSLIIERDDNFDHNFYELVLDDIAKARSIVEPTKSL